MEHQEDIIKDPVVKNHPSILTKANTNVGWNNTVTKFNSYWFNTKA